MWYKNFLTIFKMGYGLFRYLCAIERIQTLFIQYRKSTSIRHFEQCNQSLSNLNCQNCDGSIKVLLDVGNQ